MGKQCNVKGLS